VRVLVACEESQAVTKELRKRGHEAYSCDIQDCSGGHPEWHLQCDVTQLLKIKWDMIIAFPPCTYLTVSGNAWFNIEKYGEKAVKRHQDRKEAIDFFMLFATANCDKIAIENPIGVMGTEWRKADQIIQPYYFGHEARKSTCLWLKGLPLLQPTKIVSPGEITKEGYSVGASANGAIKNGVMLRWNDPETAKIRSKTYSGIAEAMAEQWTNPKYELLTLF